MGVEVVSRDEAIELGIITKDSPPPKSSTADYNAKLEASVSDLSPAKQNALKQVFGDQVQISGGKATWLGSGKVLGDTYASVAAADEPPAKGAVELGLCRSTGIDKLRSAGAPCGEDTAKSVELQNLWHIAQGHGENHESNPAQVPISAAEAKYLNWVIDAPDTASARNNDRYILTRQIDNVGEYNVVVNATNKAIKIVTAYIKK
jgi:hypothetical protein